MHKHKWTPTVIGSHRDIPARECSCGKIERIWSRKKEIDNNNKTINSIQTARTKNNINWMDILRIAIKYAPDETRDVLRRIQAKDAAISTMFESLSA